MSVRGQAHSSSFSCDQHSHGISFLGPSGFRVPHQTVCLLRASIYELKLFGFSIEVSFING